jgi:hypothetical protein
MPPRGRLRCRHCERKLHENERQAGWCRLCANASIELADYWRKRGMPISASKGRGPWLTHLNTPRS